MLLEDPEQGLVMKYEKNNGNTNMNSIEFNEIDSYLSTKHIG